MLARRLSSLNVRYRLGLLVALSIVALLAVGLGGWRGISKTSHSVISLQKERLPAAILIGEIRSTTTLLLQLSSDILRRENQLNAQGVFLQTVSRKDALGAALDKIMSSYELIPKSSPEAEAWLELKEAMKPWKESNSELSKILRTMSENDDPEIQGALFSDYKTPLGTWSYVQEVVDDKLAKLLALNNEEVEKARDRDTLTIEMAMRFMGVTLGLAITILLVLAVFFARSITSPLESLRHRIVSVASSNDFTERADANGNDEIAQTADAFNRLLENVQVSLREVLASAENIALAAVKVSTASQAAADSSESQSEAANSMAAAIEELTVSISHIKDSC